MSPAPHGADLLQALARAVAEVSSATSRLAAADPAGLDRHEAYWREGTLRQIEALRLHVEGLVDRIERGLARRTRAKRRRAA